MTSLAPQWVEANPEIKRGTGTSQLFDIAPALVNIATGMTLTPTLQDHFTRAIAPDGNETMINKPFEDIKQALQKSGQILKL